MIEGQPPAFELQRTSVGIGGQAAIDTREELFGRVRLYSP